MSKPPLSLHILDSLSEPGGSHNEDRVFHSSNTAWILDGASGLTDSRRTESASDAVWLVDTAVQKLHTVTESSLTVQLESVIRALQSIYPSQGFALEKFDVPSAVGTGIRLENNRLDFLHFGDCALVVVDPDYSELYTSAPSALQRFDRDVINTMSTVRLHKDLDFAGARNEVLPLLQANRARANSPDGYGNISVFGETPQPSISGTLGVRPGTTGLIATDGFYALVDTYRAYNPVNLVKAAQIDGLRGLYDKLRELEEQDSECTQFPRLKQHDDASALFFEIR